MVQAMQRILLIGATSAVAGSLARLYRAQGAHFYFLARSEAKLQPLLVEFGSSVVGSECLDFVDYDAGRQAIERAYERSGWFDLVVMAHGYLGDQLKSETDFDESLAQIAVNYCSVVTQLIVLSQKVEQHPERTTQIAVLTSVAGDRGRPRNYTYGSAKGALTLYLQGLRSRFWKRLTITTIKLGPVHSPMTVDHEKNALFVSSEAAARGIQRAILNKRGEVYVPSRWWWIMSVVKHLPEPLFQKFRFLAGR